MSALNADPVEADDICSLEASDRPDYWDVMMWAPDGAGLLVATVRDRERARGLELAARIAQLVNEWRVA